MALPGGGTNCAYWERVAADYDCEIMDTLTEDKGKVLRKRLRDCCRKLRKTKGGILALDAGCGAGKWLPFLGSLVDDLLAIDCSQKLVERQKGLRLARQGDGGRAAAGAVSLRRRGPHEGRAGRSRTPRLGGLGECPDRAGPRCACHPRGALNASANGGYLVLLVPSKSARAVANVYAPPPAPKEKARPE